MSLLSRRPPARALRRFTAVGALLLLTSCGTSSGTGGTDNARPAPESTALETELVPPAPTMPDLVGVPEADAGQQLGELAETSGLDLSSEWGRPLAVRCEARPGTVARQHPAPGVPVHDDTRIRIRTAALDLADFRGPCDGAPERISGPDAELARTFYRFAADPGLGAPFADGPTWVGIEDGPTANVVAPADRADLAAWQIHTSYAERSGPFSALDALASSGGHFDLSTGIVGTCSSGNSAAPPALSNLRAVSLTAPADVTSSCMTWWGVTLFLDKRDQIRGVALRLGAP